MPGGLIACIVHLQPFLLHLVSLQHADELSVCASEAWPACWFANRSQVPSLPTIGGRKPSANFAEALQPAAIAEAGEEDDHVPTL